MFFILIEFLNSKFKVWLVKANLEYKYINVFNFPCKIVEKN